jgi:hypothetical protein
MSPDFFVTYVPDRSGRFGLVPAEEERVPIT